MTARQLSIKQLYNKLERLTTNIFQNIKIHNRNFKHRSNFYSTNI